MIFISIFGDFGDGLWHCLKHLVVISTINHSYTTIFVASFETPNCTSPQLLQATTVAAAPSLSKPRAVRRARASSSAGLSGLATGWGEPSFGRTRPAMARMSHCKYWASPIYRMYNPIEITSYNWPWPCHCRRSGVGTSLGKFIIMKKDGLSWWVHENLMMMVWKIHGDFNEVQRFFRDGDVPSISNIDELKTTQKKVDLFVSETPWNFPHIFVGLPWGNQSMWVASHMGI